MSLDKGIVVAALIACIVAIFKAYSDLIDAEIELEIELAKARAEEQARQKDKGL